MDSQTFGTIVRQLRELSAPAADADLVRAFADRRDSIAFAEVVRRHGPMVLGVCRRVLGNGSDADDAFQATFLVLIRKAGSLRQADRLAGWLHQVALRTARKLRAIRSVRRGRESQLIDVPAGESTADFIWRELRPIFDEELSQLPERLRLPAVLCFLEGCSKAEASRRLGWPEGTVSGRLQRAREWLRARFTARGLTLLSGALAVALFDAVGAAAVSEPLIESTLQLAAINPAISAGVRALADGVTQAMFLSKVKAVAAGMLMVGVVGTGTGVVVLPGGGPDQVVASEPAKSAPPSKDGPKQGDPISIVKPDVNQVSLNDKIVVWLSAQRRSLVMRIDRLRTEANREKALIQKGVLSKDGNHLKQLEAEIGDTEAELAKLDDPKVLAQSALLLADLEQQKERLAYEERMVKKGFVTESQLLKTKSTIAHLENELAKVTAPKAPDPRRAAMEALIQKMEEIVAGTADGVKKGVIPRQELLNAEQRVLEYKFKLLELDGKSAAVPKVIDRRTREALEAPIKKLEEIVQQTADGVSRGIVPKQELLNSEATLARYQFELAKILAEASEAPSSAAKETVAIEVRRNAVKQKEAELLRAEQLQKQKVVALEEVRQLRIDLARLRAELATPEGDHSAAVQHRESVVLELEDALRYVQSLFERKVASAESVRKAEAALAEARIERLQAGIRKHLAELVVIREQELQAVKKLFETKVASVEDVRKAEAALADAKRRLAEGR